ncbi:MAG: sensor histidine kinase [Eubacteriales bacterium]|nr:sensor histidine kinase [Eubacteriales bacterium]
MKWKRCLNLQSRILLIVMLSILMISSVALGCIQIVEDSSKGLLHDALAGVLTCSGNEIARHLGSIEEMSGLMLADSAIQEQLTVIKDSTNVRKRTIANQALSYSVAEYRQHFATHGIRYMNLVNDSFTTYSNRIYSNQTPAGVHEAVVKAAAEADGAPCWVTEYQRQAGLFLGRTIRRTAFLQLDVLGTLCVSIDLDSLISSISKSIVQCKDAQYLLMDDENILYLPSTLSDAQAETVRDELEMPYAVIPLNGQPYFAVKGFLPNYHWIYICLVPYSPVSNVLRLSRLFCILIMIVTSILVCFISRGVIHSLTRHFDRLIQKMQAFSQDEAILPTDLYDYRYRTDEIGVLHRQFDDMAQKVRDLIRINYTNELFKKEAQLKALESQINPHFLYNTLNAISWRAKAAGERDISAMVEALGDLLRTTLRNQGTTLPLGKELQIVNSYMTIQQFRFDDRLEYEVCMEDAYLQVEIPKLSIQPLVENAVQYALETTSERCSIKIDGNAERNVLHIRVRNTLSEFESDLLEKLRSKQIRANGFGIGLLNIEKRLKLTFGEEYGLILRNENGCAVAEITVPLAREETCND